MCRWKVGEVVFIERTVADFPWMLAAFFDDYAGGVSFASQTRQFVRRDRRLEAGKRLPYQQRLFLPVIPQEFFNRNLAKHSRHHRIALACAAALPI
ncbi:hypothetical protein VSS37_17550 [Candidatus Thiothrix sp. Deng01]|uniref:Uncharacterized protein n=1 Tax=Candidatus Thiothrix phosphatis TaxID=3112415 RepID=A0ABU6D1R8_9GAMM|nr:hypothetical protein [Candidatus Thiothrix sp. Deng01]MEB4592791.1 hypothetical protein [Candidatus Thiothrix sp. Deng01]